LNATNLTEFNLSSRIILNSITFVNPRPVKDIEDDGTFVDCVDPDCVEVSFTGGVFVFNTTSFTSFQAADGETPNVTDLTPPTGSLFNFSDTIEIGANVTDDVAVENVTINITLPNGTIVEDNLSANAGTDFFNTSFTIPQLNGTYTVRVIANDSAGNVNSTETVFFVGFASECGILGQSLTLINNVSATGTCFNIIADNVTLDCNGFTISYDSSGNGGGYGVNITGRINATVENCVVNDVNAGGANGYGIFLTLTNNSLVNNNTIQTNGTSTNVGIRMQSSSYNNTLTNNTIHTQGTSANNYGIYLFTNAENNTILANTISTNGTSLNIGIFLDTRANNNTIRNNTINTIRIYTIYKSPIIFYIFHRSWIHKGNAIQDYSRRKVKLS